MDRAASIAILTYRRPLHLERALASACAQRGDIREIMVVDNAADDRLGEWLNDSFPGVEYIPMPFNGGCEGRNAALRSAHAPVVIMIDDDVELVGTDCALRALDRFEETPDLACIDFRITDPKGRDLQRDWCHPRPIAEATTEFETHFILEGACALRRESALAVGGYPAEFFLGHEGVDLAYKLIGRGERILYTPDISVVHYAASDQRPASRLYYYYTRNGIWIAYRHFPPFKAVGVALENTARMAFFAIRAGQFRAHVNGCVAALREIGQIQRHPLNRTAQARLKTIRAHRPGFMSRVRRHLRERIQ
jgi:GT2 family glycosyltransferase